MIHINNFIDKIQVSKSRFDTNFIMTMQEAEGLHSDITKLLIALQEISVNKSKDEVTDIEIKGNDW